jgi:WD40 repeat protein
LLATGVAKRREVGANTSRRTLAAGYVRDNDLEVRNSNLVSGVVLFDAAARRRRRVEDPLPGATGDVVSVAFTPDGRTLAAGDGGGLVLWDVAVEAWLQVASKIANRNFTWDEWRLYFPDKPYRPTISELPIPPKVTSNNAVRSR